MSKKKNCNEIPDTHFIVSDEDGFFDITEQFDDEDEATAQAAEFLRESGDDCWDGCEYEAGVYQLVRVVRGSSDVEIVDVE